MNNDEIIRQRISGRSVRRRTSAAGINEAIDRWAATAINNKDRKTTLQMPQQAAAGHAPIGGNVLRLRRLIYGVMKIIGGSYSYGYPYLSCSLK